MKLLWFYLLFLPTAWAGESESLPLWEYGAGVGSVYFAEYPASDEYRSWTLPFPTFQYRGEIFRADDREGARAYLLKKNNWSLEMGGGGLASLKSEDNEAREGMDDIPWGFQMGPQIVGRLTDHFHMKLGFYGAINTDFRFTKSNGAFSELQFVWLFDDSLDSLIGFGKSKGRFTVGLEGATQDFMSTYYEVSKTDARTDRPQYEARGGALRYLFSYMQAITIRPWGFYFGVTSNHYDISANRTSALHKQDRNTTGFIGLTYIMGESERRARPENEIEGALPKIKYRIDKYRAE